MKKILIENKSVLTLIEFEKLINSFEKKVEAMRIMPSKIFIRVEKNNYEGINIFSNGFNITIHFNKNSTLTNEMTYIFISFWTGVSNEQGDIDKLTPYEHFEADRLKFDINDQNKYGWTGIEPSVSFRSTDEVVTFWVDKFIEKVMERIHPY